MSTGFKRPRLTTAVLVFVNAAFVALIVAISLHGTQLEKLKKTRAKQLDLPAVTLDFPQLNGDFNIIRTRALFYSTREFYIAPVAAMEPPPPPKPNYRLTGTLAIPNKPMIAMLTQTDGTATRKVIEGDALDAWTVKTVEVNKVVLTAGAQTEELVSAKATSSGLTRQPLVRATAVSAGGVRTLSGSGASGGVSSQAQALINRPRLYRPPPQR